MSNFVLEAQEISKAFGTGSTYTCVLKLASVRFWPGQISLLMGPSGSGKSTSISILSGLLRPDAGSVRMLGQDVWKMSDARRTQLRLDNVGFVFQQDNLLPSLTIRQQLEMILKWGHKQSSRQATSRVTEILETFGIREKAELWPRMLSGGEKQRASIARALLKVPKICFVDEPTSALDWKTGKAVINCLRRTTKENGTTTIVITHDQRLVPYADVVHSLEDGKFTLMDRSSLLLNGNNVELNESQ